jgi:hypothetical protein
MNADCDSAKSDNFAGELGAMSGVPRNPPGFQRSDWLSFGATTLLALLVYLFGYSGNFVATQAEAFS